MTINRDCCRIIRMNQEEQNKNPIKSFINTVLIILTIAAFIGAFIYIAASDPNVDMNMLIGIGAFPAIGLLMTPNIILYAIKSAKKLHKTKHSDSLSQKQIDGFYSVQTSPFDFDRKLIFTILRKQLFGAIVIISILAFLFLLSFDRLDSASSKVSGGAVLLILGVLIFGIPAFSYFLTNLILRIRIVRRKEYDSCHAIVAGVDYKGLRLNGFGTRPYKYAFCVGARNRDIHNTPATLVFILDEVYVIPDDVANKFSTF